MSVTFEKWIRWVFDRPIDEGDPWYWSYSGDVVSPNGAHAVEYLTSLFSKAPEVLKPYSNAQAEQGLQFLLSRACSDECYLFDSWFDESIAWGLRKMCIDSVETMFSEFYRSRCSERFSPSVESWKTADPLHGSCFMWWDFVTSTGGCKDERVLFQVRDACLDVMGAILKINFRPSWWSALHGLGHWGTYNQSKADLFIETFLSDREHVLGTELRAYAEKAKLGEIQ